RRAGDAVCREVEVFATGQQLFLHVAGRTQTIDRPVRSGERVGHAVEASIRRIVGSRRLQVEVAVAPTAQGRARRAELIVDAGVRLEGGRVIRDAGEFVLDGVESEANAAAIGQRQVDARIGLERVVDAQVF